MERGDPSISLASWSNILRPGGAHCREVLGSAFVPSLTPRVMEALRVQ